MIIDSIDRGTVKLILDEAREALTVVAEKHGLVLERKHCTYSSTEVPVAFKFVVPQRTEDGEAIDPKETAFKRLAHGFGLEPGDYGKMFRTHNGVYRVCGIKPKARKYPVLGSHIHTGKTYKFRVDAVKDGLKAQEDLKSSMSFT